MTSQALWDAVTDEFPDASDNDRLRIYGWIQHELNKFTAVLFEDAKTAYESGTL